MNNTDSQFVQAVNDFRTDTDSSKLTITKDEYYNLRVASAQLERLEVGGVDNWDWYGESLNPDGEPDMDEIEETIQKEIYGTVTE